MYNIFSGLPGSRLFARGLRIYSWAYAQVDT
jgi:hypothetical protein